MKSYTPDHVIKLTLLLGLTAMDIQPAAHTASWIKLLWWWYADTFVVADVRFGTILGSIWYPSIGFVIIWYLLKQHLFIFDYLSE